MNWGGKQNTLQSNEADVIALNTPPGCVRPACAGPRLRSTKTNADERNETMGLRSTAVLYVSFRYNVSNNVVSTVVIEFGNKAVSERLIFVTPLYVLMGEILALPCYTEVEARQL